MIPALPCLFQTALGVATSATQTRVTRSVPWESKTRTVSWELKKVKGSTTSHDKSQYTILHRHMASVCHKL